MSSKEYHLEYQRRRYNERKRWAHDYLGGQCTYCGSRDGLEVDHVDPATKEFTVSDGYSKFSIERLAKELDKCQLLCGECHDHKSRFDRAELFGFREFWEHGTIAGYRRGCRCEGCTSAQNRSCADRRRSHGASQRLAATCGEYRKYRQGCRCDDCKAANTERCRKYRESKTVPPAGFEPA